MLVPWCPWNVYTRVRRRSPPEGGGTTLPRRDAAGTVADDERPVPDEKPERGHRRAGRAGHVHRFEPLRALRLAHVVPDDLSVRRPDEQILAAPVELERGDLAVEPDRRRRDRFFLAAAADQRFLLDDRVDEQIGRTDLGYRERTGGGCDARQAQDRALPLGIEPRG